MFLNAPTTASTQNRQVSVFQSKYSKYCASGGTIKDVTSAARMAIHSTEFFLMKGKTCWVKRAETPSLKLNFTFVFACALIFRLLRLGNLVVNTTRDIIILFLGKSYYFFRDFKKNLYFFKRYCFFKKSIVYFSCSKGESYGR